MKEVIVKQVQFEYWANFELLQTLKQVSPLNKRALLLFAHINAVNLAWLCRLKETAVTTSLFQERTLAECEQLLHENNTGWTRYLENCTEADLEKIITFHFPVDGPTRIISRKDAVFHVTNHSSYHRGQIISLIKGSTANLPMLGYVFFASKINE